MRRSVILLAIVMLALLGAMAATPLLVQAPALRSQYEPARFDAAHAKGRLGFVIRDYEGTAERAHPADTAEDDRVRERLLVLLRGMGLKPIVRDQFACNELFKERGVSCARVRNVVVALGPPTGKALLLNAHYDSTPVGPGAADDGIGVATLLEVAAKLKNQPLNRPVILLFNEGEELGLIGARAFLADPLSRNVDSLINLEARGVRGPVNMFETSRPNAAPISIYASAVDHPVANSLSTDVYRLLPNYTDVNSFSERGWLTLNLAPIGNETRYHSSGDNVEALDPATLQHMGDQTLALSQALAKGTPKSEHGNRIFMDITGRALITLPLVIGAGLLMGLLIGFVVLSIGRGGLARGAATMAGTIVGSTILAWLVVALIGLIRPGMFWRAHPIWTHLTVYAGALLVTVALLIAVGGTLDRTKLRPAFWFIFLIVGGAIGLIAPGGIVFFIFPPLLALVGMLASRGWQPAERIGSYAAIAFLYLTWGAMLGLLQELLNGGPMWIFAPLASLLILPVLIEARPLLAGAGLRPACTTAGALLLLGTAAALASPAYSEDRQQRFAIQHITDTNGGKSWWGIQNDRAPLPSAMGSQWKWDKLAVGGERWLEPAPGSPNSNVPQVRLVSQIRTGNERTLTLRVEANGSDDIEIIAPEDAKIRSAGVPGFVRPIDRDESGKYFISCFGRSCDGAMLQVTTSQLKPISAFVVGSRRGLPGSAAPLFSGRPLFARPQYGPDATIAFARIKL